MPLSRFRVWVTFVGLAIAIVTLFTGMLVPEVRQFFGLDAFRETPVTQTNANGVGRLTEVPVIERGTEVPEVPSKSTLPSATAQQWFERGFYAVDVDEKLRFYTEAIRLKPDFAEAFKNRGLARHAKHDLEGAIHDYNEAIRLNPDLAEAFDGRGAARKAKGDERGATQDYKRSAPAETPLNGD